MRFLGKLVKALLRSLFSIIIFLLFVGLAKMKWDINSYISFLNTTDWSVFHWSQPSTRADPFRPQQEHVTLDDLLSDDAVDTGMSDIDPYDPSFEQELNAIVDGSLSGDEAEYGFTTEGQSTGIHKSSDTSSSQLLKLIKQRELTK